MAVVAETAVSALGWFGTPKLIVDTPGSVVGWNVEKDPAFLIVVVHNICDYLLLSLSTVERKISDAILQLPLKQTIQILYFVCVSSLRAKSEISNTSFVFFETLAFFSIWLRFPITILLLLQKKR